MKILFVGNYWDNNGPANVNKNLLKYLSKEVCYLKNKNIALRTIENIYKTCRCKYIIISGISKFNYINILLSKLFSKKIIYIMHGCVEYENKINGLKNEKACKLEKLHWNSSEIILCVSEKFKIWFNENYPKYIGKSSYLNNGVEWDIFEDTKEEESEQRDKFAIITMGGGRPQKNNIRICEAIQLLNEKYNKKFTLYVLGRDHHDTCRIKEFPYVKYIGQVSQKEAKEYMKKAKIFIQNSSFESFGLAPIEGLLAGCDLLLSKNVGAASILETIKDEDIIDDCYNVQEIAEKIIYVAENSNYKRLLAGIDRNLTSYNATAERLLKIIKDLDSGE